VVWDEAGSRHWLLLELVQGRTQRLLVNYDGAYFRDIAERALRAVGSCSPWRTTGQ